MLNKVNAVNRSSAIEGDKTIELKDHSVWMKIAAAIHSDPMKVQPAARIDRVVLRFINAFCRPRPDLAALAPSIMGQWRKLRVPAGDEPRAEVLVPFIE